MENTVQIILCVVSRLRAALLVRRLVLSCRRLTSSPQCMLSMDQCLRTMSPNLGVCIGKLVTYRCFSTVHFPVDLLTISDSYSTIVIFPPHFCLSAIMSSPSQMRYVRVSILPCPNSGPSVYECIGVSDASVCPSQHYAVVQTVPDVPFTRPSEIGDR